MGKFEWQHIQFEDGSNPYICITEKAFKYMKNKYKLIPIKNKFWLAKNIDYKDLDFVLKF